MVAFLMEDRSFSGLIFVTTFGPLCMILVAVMSHFFLHERMLLGRSAGYLFGIVPRALGEKQRR
ncbi:transmembrane protein, putative [Medicago truncatula]|uniref:Transmembrane protein, putative n=1 Tax=Medicago truncatula TaxID=3880 RepID=G7I5L4_MEDTR|nr:transmembrane protein, putative [Medicago truncatula]